MSNKTTPTHDGNPHNKCPGCGVDAGYLSNCGRYACIEAFGNPIVLDPVHRSKLPDSPRGKP